MKITLAVIGKTEVGFVRQGIEEYVKRLQHYVTFNIQYVGDVKGTRNMSEAQQKAAEGRALLATLETSDHVVLLDEHGTERTSIDFSQWLQRRMASGVKRPCGWCLSSSSTAGSPSCGMSPIIMNKSLQRMGAVVKFKV